MESKRNMLDEFFKIVHYQIIILLPWLALINSERRVRKYIEKGLKKVVHLPCKAFPGARVQTCILVFQKGPQKGYRGNISLEFAEPKT